jgi:glycosyltransferase involved in cell wall biosynthesis
VKRIALVADLQEERWPSMDLVAEELQGSLQAESEKRRSEGGESLSIERLRPSMRRRFSGGKSFAGKGYTADRLLNRFFDYPRHLRARRTGFDLFHLTDHSYSQLVHALPGERTVVTCHDVDTFRCLWEHDHEGRGPLFLAMTRRILSGLKKAAHICCDSEATRDELLGREVMPPERVSLVRLGLRSEFNVPPGPAAEAAMAKLLGDEAIDLLHVGSTIPRKRIDVLLQVFARVRKIEPRARLLRVGGSFTPDQERQIDQLALRKHILVLPFLSPAELAVVYRRASLLLLPSDAEGFGLPLVEALASGTPVLASDLPVLHEIGGEAVEYAPVADPEAWTDRITAMLATRNQDPIAWEIRRERGRRQAALFSWAEAARRTFDIYRQVLDRAGATKP